jgi:hypothetical protein
MSTDIGVKVYRRFLLPAEEVLAQLLFLLQLKTRNAYGPPTY